MSGAQVSATYNKHRWAALTYSNCMTTINHTKKGDLQLFNVLHKLFDTRLQHCYIWSVSVSLLHLSCYSLSRNVPRKPHLFLFFRLLFYFYFCGVSTLTYLRSLLVSTQSATFMRRSDVSQILDDFLCVLCFPSSRLASGIHKNRHT